MATSTILIGILAIANCALMIVYCVQGNEKYMGYHLVTTSIITMILMLIATGN